MNLNPLSQLGGFFDLGRCAYLLDIDCGHNNGWALTSMRISDIKVVRINERN
jgi:hypothetical protein